MTYLKTISAQLFFLMIDIVYFCLRTLTRIKIPGKYQKGNLLSTLFTLFLGISERMLVFEKVIFSNKRLINHRYIRKAFIITASLLFLLTSIEWTDTPVHEANHTIYILKEKVNSANAEKASFTTVPFVIENPIYGRIPDTKNSALFRMDLNEHSPIYLLVCNFRI